MEDDMWVGLASMAPGFERWKWATFSFRGAMRRQGYWGYGLINNLIFNLPMSILVFASFTFAEQGNLTPAGLLLFLGAAFGVPTLWSFVAIGAKRCRSIGWPPFLAVGVFIPYAGGLISVIIGCLRQKPDSHKPIGPSMSEVFD